MKTSTLRTLATLSALLFAGAVAADDETATTETVAITDLLLLPNETAQVLDEPFPYEFPAFWIDEDVEVVERRRAAVQKRTRVKNPDPFPMQKCNGYKLEEATIDQMQKWMENGKLSSVDIVLCYVRRIQQTDDYIRYGP